MLGVGGVGPDRVGVAEGPQVVDSFELGAVEAQDVDHRPGREQRLVEADLLLALELRYARLGSSAMTLVPVSSSTSFSAYQAGIVHIGVLRPGSPRRYSLESGGRS